MNWTQNTITLPRFRRGFHLVTREITQALPEIREFRIGQLHVFLLHTSASLCLSENADPDVQTDLEMGFSRIAPEDFPYIHTAEGPDDMPAHIKNAMLGSSLTIPVTDGRLNLGTWQGIYLCEHRNHASARKVVLTLQGMKDG
jgi:secondary thiamine-phosphate synthase enzyme